MAAELPTPLDELTGLPLPLLPSDKPLPLRSELTNWHHHFHPSTHPVIKQTLGGRALRNSRIQLVEATQHNYSQNAYHRFYSGPDIPEDSATQFGMCVMAAAGYVPERAIDTASGQPRTVAMAESQIEQLKLQPTVIRPEPTEIRRYGGEEGLGYKEAEQELLDRRTTQAQFGYRNLRYGYENMRAFFTEYVLGQELDVRPSVRDPFLMHGDITKGMTLLSQAAKQAVDRTIYQGQSLQRLYDTARTLDRLHPHMPPFAASLVKYKLGDTGMRMSLLPELRQAMIEAEAAA